MRATKAVLWCLIGFIMTVSAENKCGTSYSAAACGTLCPKGIDSECPSGQRCYADPPACTSPTKYPTVPPTTGSSPTPSGSGNCKVGSIYGNCESVTSCAGISMSGYCSGSSSIQCCVLEPTSSTVMHKPKTPSTSGQQGTCTTPQNKFKGNCIPVSSCTGATFNDLCPGSTKCCATETRSVPDLLKDPTMSSQVKNLHLLSLSVFKSLFTGISSTRAEALFPFYNYALAEVLMDAKSSSESCYRSAAFAAQVGHESVGLLYFEEIASGAAYEGREDLGNTQPGDGVRYKGRGPIQLTGRANYASASSRVGYNFESIPESVCYPSWGFITTVDYWMSRNLNKYAGSSSESDFVTLTKLINGGTNGLSDRQQRWYTARRLLGCDSLLEVPFDDESQNSGNGKNDTQSIIVAVSALLLVAFVMGAVATRMLVKREKTEKEVKEMYAPAPWPKFSATDNPLFDDDSPFGEQ